MEICSHLGLKHIHEAVNHLLDSHKPSSAALCRICMTDYQIELTKVDHNGQSALVITRGINLGLGLSQQDPLWQAHSLPDFALPSEHRGSWILPDDYEFSPRSCFEHAASQSFKVLRTRNLSYLHDEQYKDVLSTSPWSGRASRRLWFCLYKEPQNTRG